jgi:hypothetical protein
MHAHRHTTAFFTTVLALSLGACVDGVDGPGAASRADADLDARASVDGPPTPTPDGPRAPPADTGPVETPDARNPDASGPDATPPGPTGERVEVDLSPYLTARPGDPPTGRAAVRVAAGPGDLATGAAAQGRPGDWVLENERVRFVIERAARLMGPCPWGGNVIDAAVRSPDGADGPAGEDVVGEGCLFLNVAQTFAPDTYEVLFDGSAGEGGTAVLAVTGHVELLDFIHLQGMIEGFLPGAALRIPWPTETPPALTITQYFILRPGDQGVRVVTAFRNDGATAVHAPVGFFIDSGGSVEFFSPTGSRRGFGYRDLSPETISGEPLTLLAFRGERGSHAYLPEPDPTLAPTEGLPRAGFNVTIAGVAVSILGRETLIPSLLPPAATIPTMPGLLHLEPGAQDVRVHTQYVGGGALSDMLDSAWVDAGLTTGMIRGLVRRADGAAVEGARVSAVDAFGRTMNQALSGPDGAYAMRVPAGSEYVVRAYAPGRLGSTAAGRIGAGETATADVGLPMGGRLRMSLRRPDGRPTPGKVTVLCEGPCRDQPIANDRDVTFDGPVDGSAATVFVGAAGEADIPLAAGEYRVVVSRGPEWSVWPPGAVVDPAGGRAVTVTDGGEVALTAEIAQVVDDAGTLSGDFHVHAVPSPDSPVSLENRVRTFLGEGVDVIVSTDHDVITDYAPVIAAQDAGAELASVIGLELTTFDYGHYNGFPLVRDDSPNGGAFDWAGGAGPGRTPTEIFDYYEAFPGTQVIQINHPESGYFRALRLDPLRGTSHADPAAFRMPAATPEPVTGDTGLFDERFTAIELLNGYSQAKFNGILRWWLAMIGRGFSPTATAVSDTHKRLSSQAGGPRSHVFLDPARASIASFDAAHFAERVNDGALVGSTGPFLRVEARTPDGMRAGLGQVLPAPGGVPVTLSVTVDLPEWMRVDTLELYANVTDDLDHGPGAYDEEPLPPTATWPIPLGEVDLREAAVGTERHRHFVRTVEVEYQPPADTDAYLVVVVRHRGEGGSMFPVQHSRSARPMAFANPIFVDTDGGGYDHPPLAAAARLPFEARRAASAAPPPRAPRMITPAEVDHLLRETAHDH